MGNVINYLFFIHNYLTLMIQNANLFYFFKAYITISVAEVVTNILKSCNKSQNKINSRNYLTCFTLINTDFDS